MSETGESSQPIEPTDQASNTVKEWRRAVLDIGSLKTGDIISGISNSDELDIFASNVGNYLAGSPQNYYNLPRETLTRSGRKSYDGWHAHSTIPSEAMKPRFGNLQDISILMLDDEPRGPDASVELDRKRFLISADNYIAGKGVVGKVAKRCTMGAHTSPQGKLTGFVNATYRDVPSQSLEVLNEAVLRESSEAAREVIREGLKRLYSGGLPGSKR